MPAKLTAVKSSTGEKFDYVLSSDEVKIGRSLTANELPLHDSQVSREHAVIRHTEHGYLLTDLNSANGTFVNKERITARILADKDTISIGQHIFVFEAHGPQLQYEDTGIGDNVLVRSPEEVTLGKIKAYTDATTTGQGGEGLAVLRKKAETLSRLYELSQMVSSVFSLEDIFKKAGDMIFRTTPADRFIVLLKDKQSKQLLPFATEYRESESDQEMIISKTVLDRVLRDRMSLLSIDAQTDERLEQAVSLIAQRVHSVMCAPLLSKEDVLGVIYVDCRKKMKLFSADDLDMLNALAAQTSLAVDNAMTHEQLLKEALARAAYGRFMPQHVVEQILADPAALSLGGTNQKATILFTDIRGFTSTAETLAPDAVVQMLNGYFAQLTPIIFEHRGLLDKYIGDGMMALFGVPYASEDSAANAVAAAIAIQQRMAMINDWLKEARLPEVSTGIGINTGTVTVGYIGSEQRTDYTAIGDAVNLASRLEKQAAPAQILISRSTFELIGDRFPVKPHDEILVKGKSYPIQVYEVLW